MSEMFGFQVGARLADQDNQARRLNDLAMRQGEVEIEAATTKLAQNKAFMEAINGGDFKVGNPDEAPDALERMGQIALQTGNPNQAKDFITAASTIRNTQSLAERRSAKTAFEQAQLMSNLYGGVNNAQDWAMANQQFQMMTGAPSPYAEIGYSPEVATQIKNANIKATERAAIGLSEERKKAVVGQQAETAARTDLLKTQKTYTEARTKAIEKTGGKPVPAAYLTATKNRLQDEFEELGDNTGTLGTVALPLAEQVYEKVQAEGLSLSQAVEDVVSKAIENGDLGGWAPTAEMGGHRDSPLPLTRDKKGNVDPKSLKKNRYYLIDKGPYAGRTALYTSKGTLQLVDDADDNEDDDEEDDE